MCGLPPQTLTTKVDCAVNVHSNGCHLLCHDDVIGTRRVSYIVYLTDELPVWGEEDGGMLELYGSTTETFTDEYTNEEITRKNPEPVPSKVRTHALSRRGSSTRSS